MDACKGVFKKSLILGACWVKYAFFVVHLIFAIVGCLFVAIASGIKWTPKDYNLIMELLAEPITMLNIEGGALLFLSVFGNFATIKQNIFCVSLHSILVVVPLLLEIILIARALNTHYISDVYILDHMNQTLANYTDSDYPNIKTDWDFMQYNLNCCGIYNSSDWAPMHVGGFQITEDEYNYYTVPYSCCEDMSFEVLCEKVYSAGCLELLSEYVSNSSLIIASVAISIAVIQLLFFIFICVLIYGIKNGGSVKERSESPEVDEIAQGRSPQKQEQQDLEAPSTSFA